MSHAKAAKKCRWDAHLPYYAVEPLGRNIFIIVCDTWSVRRQTMVTFTACAGINLSGILLSDSGTGV